MKIRLFLLLMLSPLLAAAEAQISGRVGMELRAFSQQPAWPGQYSGGNLSLFAEPELFWELGASDTLLLKPFVRLDQHDHERSHADIRELEWIHVGEEWELRSGIRKVFWGVTEFQHLVDVINQTDGVEDFDGEEKLGQPMVNLSLVRDWGIVDLFIMPGFRERSFPGRDGRLRSTLVVDESQTTYESAAGDLHTDLALRWSHTLGDYDIGIYAFRGTNRDPILNPGVDGSGNPVLIPFYEQMTQFGMDLQATLGDWLWKLELLHRNGNRSGDHWAAQGGFEYTLVGVADSAADLGLLMEYGWDERGLSPTVAIQNDLFVGTRLALNDAASSELLAGIGYDLDHQGRSLIVEANRRLGDSWKLSLDLRLFSSDSPRDPASSLDRDDHLQLTLERYF